MRQLTSDEMLSEDIESRKAAQDLEATLKSLSTVIGQNLENLEELHDEAAVNLADCVAHADKPQEKKTVESISASYQRYQEIWASVAEKHGAERDAARAAARQVLEAETLPVIRKLRSFNSSEIDKSEERHRRITRWLLPGLVIVGILSSLNGIFLGYSVARRLRRSVYQLSVSVRDAASRLGQDSPLVTLTEDGDLRTINKQMKAVVREIETVVSRLQQREREVLRADQLAAVGQLAAGMAHELRNPLTAVKMLVQTNHEEAERRGVPAEDLTLIEQEIRRMERCLQEFLDFARPPKLERKPLDLAAVIDRSLALVAGRARKQNIEIEFAPSAQTPNVEGDGELLQQLFVNLIFNAFDAMPNGGKLRIMLDGTSFEAVVRVLDSGPGIPAGLESRLFEPFVSGKEAGLGLGLSISKRIAETHGGSLDASNRPEGGACMRLRLPAATVVGAAV
jgi:signal transduction histidine kinase